MNDLSPRSTGIWNLPLLVIAGFALSVAVFTTGFSLPAGVAMDASEVGAPASPPLIVDTSALDRPSPDSVDAIQPPASAGSVVMPETAPVSPEVEAVVAEKPTDFGDGEAPAHPAQMRRKVSAKTARVKRVQLVHVAHKRAETKPSRPHIAAHPEAKPDGAAANDSSSGNADREPGLLRINSRPWAEIFIDGRSRGTTPNLGIPLSPGKHRVKLVNSVMDLSQAFEVTVGSGSIVTKVLNLGE